MFTTSRTPRRSLSRTVAGIVKRVSFPNQPMALGCIKPYLAVLNVDLHEFPYNEPVDHPADETGEQR